MLWTPLHFACSRARANVALVKVLVKNGADVNARARVRITRRCGMLY